LTPDHRAEQLSLALALARPDLYPEQRVNLSGFGKPEIDGGRWLIGEARHDLSDRGFTTQLQLETAI
jgi:uncharacterized protein